MFKILKKQELSPGIFHYDIEAPRVAKKARAGQFIVLRVNEEGERIPLTIADFDRVLSLNLIEAARKLQQKQAEEEAANADPEIDALVAARTEAKKAKNWAEADRIRDELKAMGIEIIDTPQGAKWRRV